MDAKIIDFFDRIAIWGQRRGWLNLVEARLHLQVLVYVMMMGLVWTDLNDPVQYKLVITLLSPLCFGVPCYARWVMWRTYRNYAEVQRHQEYLNARALALRDSGRAERWLVIAFLVFVCVSNALHTWAEATRVGVGGALLITMRDWFFDLGVWVPWLVILEWDCATHVGPGERSRDRVWTRDVVPTSG